MLNHGCVMAEDIPRKMNGEERVRRRADEQKKNKNRKRLSLVTYKMTKTVADEVSEQHFQFWKSHE